jgi:hypothetical protein
MKHNVNELYIIRHNNKRIFATLAFCNSNDICTSRREAKEQGKTLFAYQASHLEGDKIKIYDTDEILCGYIGSTTVWFDTETERNDYKEQAKKEREEFLAWNKIKKEIVAKLDSKTAEELTQILASL